jgi:hypothetical protein
MNRLYEFIVIIPITEMTIKYENMKKNEYI